MSKSANLVALCNQRGVVQACWNNAGVFTPVLVHPSYGADGLPIAAGTTDAATGTVSTGLVYTDYAGVEVFPNITDLEAGACPVPQSGGFTICIVDPTDSTVDPIPARIEKTGNGAAATVEYYSLIDGSLITLGANAEPSECDRFTYRETEQCVIDAVGNIVTRVTCIRAYDKTDTSDGTAVIEPIAPAVYLLSDGTEYVLAAGESYGSCDVVLPYAEEGCITFAIDGSQQSVRQIVPVVAGQYDFTAAFYLDLMDGTPVVVDPLVDVFAVGACQTPELPEIKEDVLCKYICDSGEPVEVEEVKVYVDGIYQTHSAAAYAASDYPEWGGNDGSGNVRSYYLLNGSVIAEADRPSIVSCDSQCTIEQPDIEWGCLVDPATGAAAGPGYAICEEVVDPASIEPSDTNALDLLDPITSSSIDGGTPPASLSQLATPNAGAVESWEIVDASVTPLGTQVLAIDITNIDLGGGTPLTQPTVQIGVVGGAQRLALRVGNNGAQASVRAKLKLNNQSGGCGPLVTAFTIRDIDDVEAVRAFVPSVGYFGYQAGSDVTVTAGAGDVFFDGTVPNNNDPNSGITFVFVDVPEFELEVFNQRTNADDGSTQAFAFYDPPATQGPNFTWVTAPPAELILGCPETNVVCTNYNADGTENTTGTFNIECPEFDYEYVGPLCVFDTATNSKLAEVRKTLIVDTSAPDNTVTETFNNLADGSIFAFDAATMTIGSCSEVKPERVYGCLWDSALNAGRAVFREVLYIGPSYDDANPIYKLVDGGTYVVPNATETFTMGECGAPCYTC